MTRDEFFNDLSGVVRLLGRLGLPANLEAEAAERIATRRVGGIRRHARGPKALLRRD